MGYCKMCSEVIDDSKEYCSKCEIKRMKYKKNIKVVKKDPKLEEAGIKSIDDYWEQRSKSKIGNEIDNSGNGIVYQDLFIGMVSTWLLNGLGILIVIVLAKRNVFHYASIKKGVLIGFITLIAFLVILFSSY